VKVLLFSCLRKKEPASTFQCEAESIKSDGGSEVPCLPNQHQRRREILRRNSNLTKEEAHECRGDEEIEPKRYGGRRQRKKKKLKSSSRAICWDNAGSHAR